MTDVRQSPSPLPLGDEKREAVRTMFDSIAPRYDLVNRVMTFGLDLAWRRRAVRLLGLSGPARVLDVACGTGDFLRLLRRRGHLPVGLDLSAGMLARARGEGPLVLADAVSMPFPTGAFDAATSGFALRNFADLAAAFSELHRVVRPGGRISLLEVAEPRSALLAAGHTAWFRHVVPQIGRLLSDPAAYRYLPESVAYLPGPVALLGMLERAGFVGCRRLTLSGGVVQVVTAERP